MCTQNSSRALLRIVFFSFVFAPHRFSHFPRCVFTLRQFASRHQKRSAATTYAWPYRKRRAPQQFNNKNINMRIYLEEWMDAAPLHRHSRMSLFWHRCRVGFRPGNGVVETWQCACLFVDGDTKKERESEYTLWKLNKRIKILTRRSSWSLFFFLRPPPFCTRR